MPQYALKDWVPPVPPDPPPNLTAQQIDKVKARVRTLLADGPMEDWLLVHHTVHEVRHTDGIATITAGQVQGVLTDMAQGDEFKEGYGKVTAQAEPPPK